METAETPSRFDAFDDDELSDLAYALRQVGTPTNRGLEAEIAALRHERAGLPAPTP